MLRYRSPLVQIILLGFICFCCPGMFNALVGLAGMGGNEQSNTASDHANTAVYAAFCLSGLLAGGAVNLLGPRITIFASGLTYALYSASYIHFNHTGQQWLLITSGALLGVGAGVLWAAQGMIIISYPEEWNKGRYIGIFWVIFNLGSVLGGLIPFFIYLNDSRDQSQEAPHHSLSDVTYIAFVVLMTVGASLGLVLAAPTSVRRDDGQYVALHQYTNVTREFIEMLKLFVNKWMLLLIPAFFSSNFFYTYQFKCYNQVLFNKRTASLNNSLYWLMQMIGSYLFGLVMDMPTINRRRRGFIGFAVSAVMFNGAWIGGVIIQSKYSRSRDYTASPIDLTDGAYAGPLVLYLLYGACDAIWQSYIYWILGSLTNQPETAARFASMYKCTQSMGAAISWAIDAQRIDYMNQLIGNWALLVLSLPLLLYVVWNIKDTNYVHEQYAEELVLKNHSER
ncbi:MFS general substrate transporter [Ramicandelaber brevisporus]|nr:MFS general substrate transporter [Ramicandelaber brevisporus]